MIIQKLNAIMAVMVLSFMALFATAQAGFAQTTIDPVSGGTYDLNWNAPPGTGLNVQAATSYQIEGNTGKTFDISLVDQGAPGDAFAIEVNGVRLTPTTENGGPETRGPGATAYYSASFDNVSIPNASNSILVFITDSCCTSGGTSIVFSDVQAAVLDSTPPVATTVSLASNNANASFATAGDTVTLTMVFDEALAAAPTVSLLGQSVTATGSGTNWSASTVVGPTSTEGNVVFAISNYQDAAGNVGSTVSATTDASAVTVDRAVPSLTISGVPSSYLLGDIFSVTFTFSEATTGFDASDVAVVGGALSIFQTSSSSVYTATLTPSNVGAVTVTIVAGAGQDSSGNPSVGANATSTIESATSAGEEITYFMENRAHALVQAQPGLTRFLSGRASAGTLDVAINGVTQNLTFASGTEGLVWGNVQASQTETATHELGYALLTMGAHAYQTDHLIIGGMVQIDKAEQTSTSGVETSGVGGMVGPYMVSQIGDQPLFLEARLLYGVSENEITPLGTYTDSFTTERWLARVGVEGAYALDNFTIFPNLSISHVKDALEAYVDGLGDTVATQSIALTEIAFGIDFETPIAIETGDLVVTGGLSGSWTSKKATGLAGTYIEAGENWGARVDLGARYTDESGIILSSGIYLAGIDSNSARRTVGGEFGLEYRF